MFGVEIGHCIKKVLYQNPLLKHLDLGKKEYKTFKKGGVKQ